MADHSKKITLSSCDARVVLSMFGIGKGESMHGREEQTECSGGAGV